MAEPTLRELLGVLDDTVLHAAHLPDGDVSVSDVAILDRADPDSLHARALVLAVGVETEGGDAVATVDRAAAAGAAAVVLRADSAPPDRLVELAQAAGVALLTVPAEMAWGQLYSLLRTAMAGAGATGGGPAGIPVGDLFALADAVAAAVGAPVTVEDPQWRVLAYSNLDQPIDEPRRQTILGRTPPREWQERLDAAGVRAGLRTATGVVRFEHEGISPRLAAPVRAGGELLGSLWAAEGAVPLGPEAEAQLARAAELAALHLMAHRAGEDLERRARGSRMRELLAGHAAGDLVRGPLTALAFELTSEDRDRWTGDPERILSVVSLYAESVHRGAMAAIVEDRFWALVPSTDRERLDDLARSVTARVEHALGLHLRAAVGLPAAGVTELPRSRASAEQALAVLGRRTAGAAVVHADEVRAHAALLELLDAARQLEGFADGRLAPAAEHDERRGTDYVGSLRAWLDAHGDVAAAASQLGVHANTLRYRIRRIAELTGIDLSDPDERLAASIELRLKERGPSPDLR